MPPKTKKILEEENKALRDKVKDLGSKVKDMLSADTNELGDNPHMALGVFKEDGKYMFAKIAYNPENDAVKLISKDESSRIPETHHMMEMMAKEFLANEIIGKVGK